MVSGDAICAGYWRQPRLTQPTLPGEWLSTGDICVQDASGHFAWHGRADDMLNVGGMWVSPDEVEAVLAEDERVVECAVVGVQDRDDLIEPEAFVVVGDPAVVTDLEGSLERHIRQRLGGNKTPRAFHFLDALPRTAAGTIQRADLRRLARTAR
jgi:acyl-coenzyme A synthetase/AMP-(fatty) acid ligase